MNEKTNNKSMKEVKEVKEVKGSDPNSVLKNIKDLAAIHNINMPTSPRYNVRLMNGDSLGVNKIIEMPDTPELYYCLALIKGKEAIFVVNKSRINYISAFSQEYTDSYNKNKGYDRNE